MADTGAITQERSRTEAAKINFPKVSRQPGAWFADWASDQVQSVLPPDRDATVRTSLDQRLQLGAEAALSTFDASTLLMSLGDAIVTGPTGNNLRDLRILLAP